MCESDLSNPACARLSVRCLCSVDLGQEDLVVLNLTSGTAAAAGDTALPCDKVLVCTAQMKQPFGFLEILALYCMMQ